MAIRLQDEEALLTGMLERYDVELSDIELINVNFSLSPALMSGQVDAVIGAFRNFELNQMDIEGVAGRCFFSKKGIPSYDELIYVATQIEWMQILSVVYWGYRTCHSIYNQ